VDLEGIPKEYHDFTDVFSKVKADTLVPHQPYDLKITLEDGALRPQPLLYFLSTSELETLQEFLEEHLNIGFIRPASSLHGAPILFVKKARWITSSMLGFPSIEQGYEVCYPLPLILEFLAAPYQMCIYSKINLQHAYHLVCITKGNEWNITF